jgi:hypothetical protein
MNRFRVAVLVVLGVVLGGCKAMMPGSATSTACGDPCAAMVCPGGSSCVWNSNCQPRCEVQPISPNGH